MQPNPMPRRKLVVALSGRMLSIREQGQLDRVDVPIDAIYDFALQIRSRVLPRAARSDGPVNEFLESYCRLDLEAAGPDRPWVRICDLVDAWAWWCRGRGIKALATPLQAALQRKGIEQGRSRRVAGKQARTWEGIGLRPEVQAALSVPSKLRSRAA
jgi:hypothetical protein